MLARGGESGMFVKSIKFGFGWGESGRAKSVKSMFIGESGGESERGGVADFSTIGDGGFVFAGGEFGRSKRAKSMFMGDTDLGEELGRAAELLRMGVGVLESGMSKTSKWKGN
jgi:hypothetical protein